MKGMLHTKLALIFALYWLYKFTALLPVSPFNSKASRLLKGFSLDFNNCPGSLNTTPGIEPLAQEPSENYLDLTSISNIPLVMLAI